MKNLLIIFLFCFCISCTNTEETKNVKPTITPEQIQENHNYLIELENCTRHIMEDNYDLAEKSLRSLRNKNITLSTWGMASFNLGIALRLNKKYKESIIIFEEILKSNLNDRDPTPNLMEHFRNYHYKACLEISYNYENLKNFKMALEYLNLAKTKYKFQDICGTCLEHANKNLASRVDYLKNKGK